MTFPIDDYTPFAYLDIPEHTRNLTPKGVVRSHDIGFRWHFPAYAGTYGGRRETYRAGFRLSLNGKTALDDFEFTGSRYHSKNIVEFEQRTAESRAVSTWQMVGPDALRAKVSASGRLGVEIEYTRLLSANGEWGESGLVARFVDGILILQGFEDGEAFAFLSSVPSAEIAVARNDGAPEPLATGGYLTVTGSKSETVSLRASVQFRSGDADVILARGNTAGLAIARARAAQREADAEAARLRAENEAFWENAPRLSGDWPAHWRRGLVYDLETLRMMVKAPVGIYEHVWDAMQIQAPRVVLAETAIDALLISYADPAVARELMYGVFADAPEINVPCTREDGTYNMVAADGTACGTAPQWGYPWLVLDWLYRLEPDRAWLERIYPLLHAHLQWWIRHRTSESGHLFYACSWESGQDDSPRYGEQPLGGGHPVRHIEPVDLVAAMAHAARTMATFATELGYPHDVQGWKTLEADYAEQTSRLWNGARYADLDHRAGSSTDVDDLMLLAPVALDVSSDEHRAALKPVIEAIPDAALVWPCLTWTAVEAAKRTGATETASALAAAVVDRAYRFWDARRPAPGGTNPGIAGEYWPLHGRCGGEGYGWGAYTTRLLLHDLIGIDAIQGGLEIRPNLPAFLREPGKRYRVDFVLRGRPVAITIEPIDAANALVAVDGEERSTAWGSAVTFS
jgi:hypothetical protein